MKFSIWPSSARPWEDLLATARFADRGGWHGIWCADHYMPNTEDGSVDDRPFLEVWAVLPALAAATSRVRLGPLVSPTSVHHPALLANRAASLDVVSGGRFVLGLGAGWQVNEHRAYGIELEAPGPRVRRFDEAIQIVRSLLDQPRTTFEGEFYSITDAPMNPKAIQERLPILVGTGGSKMLRITARHADEWNTWGDPTVVAAASARMDAACEAVGRDPASLHRSAQAMVFLADDDEGADRLRQVAPPDRSIVGTPEQLLEIVATYQDSGIEELIVPDFTLGEHQAEREDRYGRFWETVASALS
ncbi:MAG: LLM class flavin-dependent oxidoreductase [Ilumatobacteraceae bacterium]